MVALARASKIQLGGFDSNIVASELIGTETWITDVIFTAPVSRTVQSVVNGTSTSVITFTGGDNSVFAINQFLSFVDDSNVYQIQAIGTNTVTVAGLPSSKIQGDAISQSFTLDPATTFTLKATEFVSTGVTESRGTLDLGTLSVKMPQNNLDFSTPTNIIPIDLTKAWIRLNLPTSAFASDTPLINDGSDNAMYIIFAGSLVINQPANTVNPTQNPATTNVQRFCWLISSKLTI